MILVRKKYREKITSYRIRNKRIVEISLQMESNEDKMVIIGVYAPEEGREDESDTFYEKLQKVIQKYNINSRILLIGDLNAKNRMRKEK